MSGFRLRGVDYGPICCGSGAMGFFGEGDEYWFHRWLKPFGLDWSGCTFVAKTATLAERPGNMKMKSDGITPRDRLPDCIWTDHRQGMALNAVGLSNPGLPALLSFGRWQRRTEPFMISLMAVGDARDVRFKEFQGMRLLLEEGLPKFRAPVAIQVNFSCPNTEHAAVSLEEHLCLLDVLESLDVPLVPKIAVDYPVEHAVKLSRHRAVDALCASNTIRFRSSDAVKWAAYFTHPQMETSPLAKYGGGGISGAPLLRPGVEYVGELLEAGVEKPILGGGGILHPRDVHLYLNAGADAVSIASMAFLRPWRVKAVIRETRRVFQDVEELQSITNPGRDASMAEKAGE